MYLFVCLFTVFTDTSIGAGGRTALYLDWWLEKEGLAWLWKHSERCYAFRYT